MTLLPTAYFGNIDYYSKLLRADEVMIEQYEHFPKQTYRNRMLIMTANGVIPIIVPLKRSRGGKIITKEIEIDYAMAWQRNAWRAIVSAYHNSPYFDHYETHIEKFFTTKYDTLIEMNHTILETTLTLLKQEVKIGTTDEYIHNRSLGKECDYRDFFDPKQETVDPSQKVYYQVFSDRIPFAPNLSIMDLLFCEGSNSIHYVL